MKFDRVPVPSRTGLFVTVLVLLLSLAASRPQAGNDLEAILDGVAARVRACAAYKTWSATVVQKITEADESWAPRKVTKITKTMVMRGKVQEDRILKAEVVQDGRTVDITEKHAAERRVFLEKEKRRLAERAARGEDEENDPDRKHYFDLMEILPFGKESRPDFEFIAGRAGGAGAGDRAAGTAPLVIKVRPKEPAPGRWLGTYAIDPRTFDVRTAEVQPSKNPKYVKEIVLKVDLDVQNRKFFVLKRTYLKINAGFLIKRIRKIVEEEYSDVRILD